MDAVRVVELFRVCTSCGRRKPMLQFSPRRSGSTERVAKCKQCINKAAKENRVKSPRSGFRRAIARMRHKGTVIVSIDADHLISLWENQRGLCALSGIKMSFGQGLNALSASVDRFNPKKGYTKGNVRLVCFCLNALRGTLSDEEAYRVAKAFVTTWESSNGC